MMPLDGKRVPLDGKRVPLDGKRVPLDGATVVDGGESTVQTDENQRGPPHGGGNACRAREGSKEEEKDEESAGSGAFGLGFVSRGKQRGGKG
jgi:hypothetical protein